MIPKSSQSIGCSRGERLRRGGRCAGKLQKTVSKYFGKYLGTIRTQWLFLQDQEDGINQFKVFREIVQLIRVSKYFLPDPGAEHT